MVQCFALLLQRSTTLGIFALAKDMQVCVTYCMCVCVCVLVAVPMGGEAHPSRSQPPHNRLEQAVLLTPSKAGLSPLARVAALEALTLALQIKARQLSPGLVAEAQAAIAKNWKCALGVFCVGLLPVCVESDG